MLQKKGLRRNFHSFCLTERKYIPCLLITVTIETKIREFQYKELNNIVFTNEQMFRLKMTDSPYSQRGSRMNAQLQIFID